MGTIDYKLRLLSPLVLQNKEEPRYYAVVANPRTINTKTLIGEIEKMSCITSSDVKAVLDALANVSVNHLSMGHSVHLDGLGVLSIALKNRKITDPDERLRNDIKIGRVTFKAERSIVNQLQKCSFHRHRKLEKTTLVPTDEKLLEMIAQHLEETNETVFTRATLQRLTGLSRKTVCRLLKQLVETDKLVRKGTERNPFYTLK